MKAHNASGDKGPHIHSYVLWYPSSQYRLKIHCLFIWDMITFKSRLYSRSGNITHRMWMWRGRSLTKDVDLEADRIANPMLGRIHFGVYAMCGKYFPDSMKKTVLSVPVFCSPWSVCALLSWKVSTFLSSSIDKFQFSDTGTHARARTHKILTHVIEAVKRLGQRFDPGTEILDFC